MGILELTALELGKKIKAGEVTVRQAVDAALKQAEAVEPTGKAHMRRQTRSRRRLTQASLTVLWQEFRLR